MHLRELFESDNGRLSMTRFVVFCTLPISSYIVIEHYDQLANYLGAYVAAYGAGKVADAIAGNNDQTLGTTQSVQTVSTSSTVSASIPSDVAGAGLEK